ncbi:hypothetical protein Pmani_008485 [Petrolisthes manimaculis]|uniref:SWIM-type domain-containing protein n=1 Tax=Petrolisthes manimaculis TaxID=1843537 RepID=A0AAE1Q8T6_9EUCA|nr:hypothetical protein Pmani_008485 [Petrolisthes manimaculis]
MKCHKSLKAYNFFTSGWVKEVNVAPTTGLDSPGSSQSSPVIVRGRVLHSQSLSATPTNTWIIVAQDGGIMTANCDCKAGLGGTCSHVGAVLFYVDAAVRAREQKTVTQDKAYWLLPKACKKVEYKPISEIDFTSSANRKRKFDAQLCDPTAQSSDTVVKRQSFKVKPLVYPQSRQDYLFLYEKCLCNKSGNSFSVTDKQGRYFYRCLHQSDRFSNIESSISQDDITWYNVAQESAMLRDVFITSPTPPALGDE